MEALAELVRKHQVNINTSKASDESKGMLQTLLVMGLSYAAKQGMNYMIQQLTTNAGKPKSQPDAAPSSPVDEPTNVKR
jgi:hypothetical protein